MAIKDKIISFWKQVRLKSSDMFTLFRVGIGVKVPTNKLHVKDSKDPLKIEGLQNDTTDPDKFLTIDSNYIIKYRTGTEVASDIGAVSSFILEDGDGTEVTITNGSEIKFVEGSGIDIDWTDVSDGSDTDPYDITFTVDHDAATNFVAAEHVDWAGASAGTIHSTNIPTLNQNTTGNADTANAAKNVTGSTDADVSISSDGDVNITIDADGDEVDSLVLFKSRAVEIGRIDEVGNATFPGIITGKRREVFFQNFFDDLGTTKHYLPFKSQSEQTTIYQEEAAVIMPCDGRIVSVTVRVNFPNADGEITMGIHTRPVNVNAYTTASWVEEETEMLPLVNADDSHVFHFAFDNAKHFESSELVSISMQCSADISGSAYWYVSTVVEYDWNTFLGTTSVEIESTP
jgi:hypothetical protein